jgi:hypothetical protein
MSPALLSKKSEPAPPAKVHTASTGLRIGRPNDSFEREADRVADAVMAGGGPQWSFSRVGLGKPPLQRKCACGGSGGGSGECEECKKEQTLQRHATDASCPSVVPPIVHEVLRAPGQPLDAATRAFMEPRFGHDFSQVRIHTDAKAASSAAGVSALAYTVGREIVFAPRGYRPSSFEGRRLIAHELAHVLQQGAAGARPKLQRQPAAAGQGAALDADDQKIVDAAKRESSDFKCNVGFVLWGILKKHFPEDTRKVAGTGCESGLPGLRTELAATDPKNPKATRSVPTVYAGQAFIAATDAARLNDRVADVGKEIEAIDDWRLANFLIDAKDLSNPKISGQLRSMPASQLIDYRDKTKDSEVKRYADNLITFSTPTQAGSAVDPLDGNMVMRIGNVNVAIKPDESQAPGVTGAETKPTLELSPLKIPDFEIDPKGKVTNFPGYSPAATLTIVTRYQAGKRPEATSGYGRGTTPEDIRNKATALRLHEGSHGEDYIDFVRTHPLPVFTGKNGDKAADFTKAEEAYWRAVTAWGKQLDSLSKARTDCVGKTIDKFHQGEAGYKPICT